jgi:N-acetylglucosaminyldiphosphoundecaprenol N-acetyl-beta-D-mannosaminyltransferase
MTSPPTRTILNIGIQDMDLPTFLSMYTFGSVFTANIDHLVLLQEDEEFYRAYSASEYVVLDSRVLYLLFKLIGRPFCGVIHGSDLLPAFCRHHRSDPDIRIFLCGGTTDVIHSLKERINAEAGRELVVGAYAPPFGFEQDPVQSHVLTELIRGSGATVLAIGVGTPKQEKWLHLHRAEMPNVRMMLAVGAGIDFLTGKQQRAPEWMRYAGLEWFYRLLLDPRRMAVRYLVRDMRFFYYLMLVMFRIYKNPFSQQGPTE